MREERIRLRLASVVSVSVVALLAAFLSAPGLALGQAMPPVQSQVDVNGVDLLSGQLTGRGSSISIGGGQSGHLSMSHLLSGTGGSDNFGGLGFTNLDMLAAEFAYCCTSDYVSVNVGSNSDVFIQGSGGAFSNFHGRGSTLTRGPGGNGFIYTALDGTIYTFAWNSPLTAAQLASPEGGSQISSIKYPDGEVDTFHYGTITYYDSSIGMNNTRGRLLSVTNNLGYQLKLNYMSNTVSSFTQLPQWQTVTSVIAINNAIDYCDPSADTCSTLSTSWPTLTYDYSNINYSSPNYFVGITDPIGRRTLFSFTPTFLGSYLTGIRRPSSSTDTTTLFYDDYSRVVKLTTPSGTWNYSYLNPPNNSGNTSTITDPLGRTTTLNFTGNPAIYFGDNVLTSYIDGLGRTTTYSYDSSRRLQKTTNPEGDSIQYGYDTRGNTTSITRNPKAGSGLSSIATSSAFPTTCTNQVTCNEPIYIIDARGNETDYTYDPSHGGILTVTRPPAVAGAPRSQLRYTYAALYPWFKQAGSLAQGPAPIFRRVGSSTCMTGVSCSGTSDELKEIISYGVGGVANNLLPTAQTTESGDGALSVTTTLSYDLMGNVAAVDGPLAGSADTVMYRYDLAGELTGVVRPDPDGVGPLKHPATRYTYSADGQLTLMERGTVNGTTDADWTGFTTLNADAFTYDSSGHQSTSSMESGGTTYALTQYSYDAVGDLTCTAVRMNPAAFSSLPSSACTPGTTGADGPDRIELVTFDAAGQETQVTEALITPSQANSKTATYSADGYPITLLDANGNLTSLVYDGFNRLAAVKFPNAALGAGTSNSSDSIQLNYDAAGNTVSRTARDGTTATYTFDALNRLTEEDLPGSNPHYAYTYDLHDRLLSASIIGGGDSVSYSYDVLGRQTSETTPTFSVAYGYDVVGNRTRITWPDSFYANYTFDLAGRVTQVAENGATSGPGILATYAYDDLGHMSGIGRGNGSTSTFGYDPVGRLASLAQDFAGSANDVTWSFGYNAARQITSRTASNDAYTSHPTALVASYTANGLNQYSSVGGTTYSYDAKGNLLSDGIRSFSYDSENRLLSTSAPTSATFAYDAAGRLKSSATASSSTRFLYAGDQTIGEYNGAGALQRRFVPGASADAPVTWYEGAGVTDRRWLHVGDQGSVMSWSDASAAANGAFGYGAYGEPSTWAAPRYGFTGQISVPEAQLFYFKARMYDPKLGRFLQVDPAGAIDDLNLYQYTMNDPVNERDPSGLRYCAPDDKTCVESGETENDPSPPPPRTEGTNEVAELVVTAAKKGSSDDGVKFDYNLPNEQYFTVDKPNGVVFQKASRVFDVVCNQNMVTFEESIVHVEIHNTPLQPGQVALHTHQDHPGWNSWVGPGDDIAARRSDLHAAFQMSANRINLIEQIGPYFRVTALTGGAYSAEERAGIRASIALWQTPSARNSPHLSDKQKYCPKH